MPNKSVFVLAVIEGIDGSHKSTLSLSTFQDFSDEDNIAALLNSSMPSLLLTTIPVHRESIANSRKEEILLIVWSGSKFKESQ
jgi:hypothetical protein